MGELMSFSSTDTSMFESVDASELDGSTFWNACGFLDRFFPANDSIDALFAWTCDRGLYAEGRWADWPATQAALPEWFESVVNEQLLPSLAATFYRYQSNSIADLLISANSAVVSWQLVRVVASTRILQLAGLAQELFANQPSRLYVHPFTLCDDHLRAWLFDRSGAVGSDAFNIHEQPKLFLRVVCRYATMDAADLGFDPTIKWRDGEIYDPSVAATMPDPPFPYIEIPTHITESHLDIQFPEKTKIMLNPVPIFRRPAVVSRGSVVWKATRAEEGKDYCSSAVWDLVLKDQWRNASRGHEGDLLRDATADNCVDVVQHLWHGESIRITDIRRGLGRGELMTFVYSDIEEPDVESDSYANFTARERSTSASFSEQSPKGTKVADKADLIHSRLLMSPLGRPLYQFSSYTELLCALRDCIRGHRSLYQNSRILHRDISPHNLLLTRTGAGLLTDLDLAVRLPLSGSEPRTGTLNFLAIGIICDLGPHHPRHDLESFLYVLLYLCTFYCGSGGRRRPTEEASMSTLFKQGAVFETADMDIFGVTRSAMMDHRFEILVIPRLHTDMWENLGTVIEGWRKALFCRGGKKWDVEPPEDVDALYDDMIAVLDQGIAIHRERSVQE